MSGSVPCSHCGLPAPAPASGSELSFCCPGCRAAFHLMHDMGLSDYYALRDRMGDADTAQPVGEVSTGAYAHLDDEAYLEAHGYAPGSIDFYVTGLHCAACVWVIDRLPQVLPGVDSARVNYGTGRLRLDWDPGAVKLSRIAEFLHQLGYPVHVLDREAEEARQAERRRELVRLAVAGASAGNVMLVSFALYAGAFTGMEALYERFFEVASLVLVLPSVTYAAWPFYRAAWSGLRMRRLHMDLPVSLGLLAGFLASLWATVQGVGEVYFDSVATLVFLLLLGRFVQQRGQDWAISGSALLHLLVPSTAEKRVGETWLHVSSASLQPGDEIRVRPDERIPADGEVLEGRSSVDESTLTGESRPIAVEPGGSLWAGTTNLSAPIRLRVEAAGRRTRIGSLVDQIEQAGEARAPVVEMADRIAGWFVAAVLTLAVVGGLAWSYVDPTRVFDVVVALLVVSCPCALGLATPIALTVARGRAARRGILLRSTAPIERLAAARHVVLDKTGTLTQGQMEVTEVEWLRGPEAVEPDELRRLVRAVERDARHPVARALRDWAGEGSVLEADAVVERPGLGIEGDVEGRVLRIGSLGFLGGDSPDPALTAAADRVLRAGHSPVVVELDGRAVTLLGIGDRPRLDAPGALARLRDLGLSLRLFSGDHDRVVQGVAAELGIADARGEMSPDDKARALGGLDLAVMVGDGVNDAPALRAAEVGVAVGGGAEAAMRVADVYLERQGMSAVAELFEGSRRAMGVVRRNITFSLVYNVLFASLALSGLITPLAAAILMPISSLTVLLMSVFSPSFDGSRAVVARGRAIPAAQTLPEGSVVETPARA